MHVKDEPRATPRTSADPWAHLKARRRRKLTLDFGEIPPPRPLSWWQIQRLKRKLAKEGAQP